MEGRQKPHMEKYKETTNDWNYDANCMLTSLLVSHLENFLCLILLHRVYQMTWTGILVKNSAIPEEILQNVTTDFTRCLQKSNEMEWTEVNCTDINNQDVKNINIYYFLFNAF
jgi:hypothetical protein